MNEVSTRGCSTNLNEGTIEVNRRRIRLFGLLFLGLFLVGAATVEKPRNHLDDSIRLARSIKSAGKRLFKYYRCTDGTKSTGCEIFRTNFIQFHNQELLRVPDCMQCHQLITSSRYKVPDSSSAEKFLVDIHKTSADCFQCHEKNDLSADKVNQKGKELFRIPEQPNSE